MNELLSLVSMFRWSIVTGMVTAAALAALGCHLATRKQAAQTLCVGQGASLGVVIGVLLFDSLFHPESHDSIFPVFTGIAMAAVTFAATHRLSHRISSKSTLYTGIFSLLWAASYWVAGFFPGLREHLSQLYFGDLVTLSLQHTYFTLGLAVASLAFLTAFSRQVTSDSFDLALHGRLPPGDVPKVRFIRGAFFAMSLVLLCFSVQFIGLLFTLASLFIPTLIMSQSKRIGLSRHLVSSALIGAFGAGSGFTLSLSSDRFSTVPTLVLIQACLGLAVLGWERLKLRESAVDGSTEAPANGPKPARTASRS